MSQEYPAVGLRYFNVYGRGEENKGKMASMAYKMNLEYMDSKIISLFKGTGGYGDGEQKRDFIYIDDVVSINTFFMEKSKHDIYNVGTGNAYYYEYYDENSYHTIPASNMTQTVTNYQYEIDKEDDKRNIFILKPEYLNVIFNDLDDIMPYKKGAAQYVSDTLKKGENIKLYQ